MIEIQADDCRARADEISGQTARVWKKPLLALNIVSEVTVAAFERDADGPTLYS
ncbi:hypothetical protein GCM10011505_49780 [Tistrella bauzanensis]|uniref:Uncharacterized protein n=1 Tax=Tistrella bauzanensis TaxID=657419 RepID=A0ABQ1JA27_9PROT|nr:hypothetical protein GCM10011505_49780 [Tistrella bauzanensis]